MWCNLRCITFKADVFLMVYDYLPNVHTGVYGRIIAVLFVSLMLP